MPAFTSRLYPLLMEYSVASTSKKLWDIIIWPVKPKMFAIWPFADKVYWSLNMTILSSGQLAPFRTWDTHCPFVIWTLSNTSNSSALTWSFPVLYHPSWLPYFFIWDIARRHQLFSFPWLCTANLFLSWFCVVSDGRMKGDSYSSVSPPPGI